MGLIKEKYSTSLTVMKPKRQQHKRRIERRGCEFPVANRRRRLAAHEPEFKRGRVCKDWTTANSLYHAWERICKKAEVCYKKNAFRDCYITNRLAMTNDAKLVAMESGNSERMISEHYLHLATKAQAEEWFSL